MNGRDMDALAVGLDENTEFDNLDTRIRQVQYLAAKLDEYGIPYQRPVGGHAIFVDADKILTNVPKEEFPAQTILPERTVKIPLREGGDIPYEFTYSAKKIGEQCYLAVTLGASFPLIFHLSAVTLHWNVRISSENG